MKGFSIVPFSLFNATQILSIVHLPSCSPACSQIPTTHQTVESKFIIKSIKIRVQNFAYHQKSINSSSISGAVGNKSPKSGRSWSAREISTLPPKPRAEGSNPSAPAIGQGARKRLNSAFAGFFYAKIARMDTLYRYRISVAKSSKRPNIREYSNCCRLVHHQKSISRFREKDGSVPCAEDG